MRSGPCRQLFGQCVGEPQSCDLRGLRQRSLLPRRQIGHHPELDGAAGIRKQRHPVRQIRLRGAIGVMQGELHGVQIDNADPDGLVFVDSHVVGFRATASCPFSVNTRPRREITTDRNASSLS